MNDERSAVAVMSLNEVHGSILVAHSFYKINPKPFKQKIATNFLVAIFCFTSYFCQFLPALR
jgi:hypothetical protein